jgi:hypothetical protein
MELTNEYLNTRLHEILTQSSNFFDIVLQLKEFEKEYKQSEFFKQTKMPLMEIAREAKIFYLTNTSILIDKLNKIIDGLDVDKLLAVLQEGGSILEKNNDATLEQLKEFKELGGVDIVKNQQELNKRKIN